MSVDAALFDRLGICLRVTAEAHSTVFELAAAITDKHQLDLLLEAGRIIDIFRADAAAAENTDIRKGVRIG